MGTSGGFAAEPVSNLIGGVACFVTMLVTLIPELWQNPVGIDKKQNIS